MTTSSGDIIRLAEAFIKAPCFSLAYGAFSKLYENEGYVANQKRVLLSKLLELCTTMYKSHRTALNLLKQTELETTQSLQIILSCSLCRRLYFQPVVLFCGHTFCRSCVDGSFKCHSCAACITSGEVNENLLISRSIAHFYPETIPLYELLRKSSQLVKEGNHQEASVINEVLLSNFSNDARSFQAAAEAQCLIMHHSDALQIVDQGIRSHPDWPRLYFLKAKCLNSLGKHREALEYYFKCFLVYPHSDYLRHGVTQLFEDEIDQSEVNCWKRVVEHCASNPGSIPQALSELPEELRYAVTFEPWIRFPPTASCILGCPASFGLYHPITAMQDVSPVNSSTVESIRPELLCALCLRLLLYPCGLPCGHTFCRECLEQSLDYRPECPMCKSNALHYLAASDRGHCVALWKLVQFLLPEESAERQRQHEQEYTALSRVGIDPALELPVMTCCLAFPGISCPLHIFEPRYRNMVRRAINSGSRRFGMFLPGSGPLGLAKVGCILQIRNCETLPDGRMLIDTRGSTRIYVRSARVVDGCIAVSFDIHKDEMPSNKPIDVYQAMCTNVHNMAANWLSKLSCNKRASVISFYGNLPDLNSPSPEPVEFGTPMWVWWLVAVLPLNDPCRYKLLAINDPEERMRKLLCILSRLLTEQIDSDGQSTRELSC